MRRLRSKSDEDGYNPFIAGMISGLSVLLIKDQYFRAMLALYMLVRTGKIWLDMKENEGKINQNQIYYGLLILGMIMSIFFSGLYLCDHSIWPN